MSNTKKVSMLPSVSTQPQDMQPLVRTDSGLGVSSLHVLLANLLIPNAKISTTTRDNYTRQQWLSWMSGTEDWTMQGAEAGEVLIVLGSTADTKQKCATYFVAETPGSVANHWVGRHFLMLFEGEPPLWGNTSSQ